MSITRDRHIEFYNWQIEEFEEEWERYARSPVRILIQEKRLFVGRIWGIQESQGNVILRFKAGSVPRMKQPYLLCMVGSGVPDKTGEWNFSYVDFRTSLSPRLSGKYTEVFTKYYLKSDNDNWSYVAVAGFELELITAVKENSLSKGIHPLIVIAETDPPVEYLLNLRKFVEQNNNDPVLNLSLKTNGATWSPINLDNEKEILPDVLKKIDYKNKMVIQGPPGTGKSFLVARIISHYLNQNKAVVATALTNRALIEIADKEGLKEAISKGAVFKTNLSGDESKKLPGLRPVKSFTPVNGELLLTTYYKFSQKYWELQAGSKRFDLLVIEEASQAFLASIAMFCTIAKSVLIIGDHRQLNPIVIKQQDARKIDLNINSIIYGLKTYTFSQDDISFRLTKTRRLTTEASKLTGLYYDNTLKSISELNGKVSIESNFIRLFHKNGGITIAKMPPSGVGFSESNIIRIMCFVAADLMVQNEKLEVALLSPYIRIESLLYDYYSRLSSDYTRITISTIHKIQGLTADITILYLPLDNAGFDLDDNLFNVATSRARMGTLIITYEHIELVSSTTQETRTFIHSCDDVSESFKAILKDTH